MGAQEIRLAIIGLLVSAAIIVFTLVGGEDPPPDDKTVFEWVTPSDEATASDEEAALPDWLLDYSQHVPMIGYFDSGYNEPHPLAPELIQALSEFEALIDSLSPGVRANYEGTLRARGCQEERAGARRGRVRRIYRRAFSALERG